MKERLIEFDIKGDERGLLLAFESKHNIPFDIQRVFTIYNTKTNVSRGKHAHYETKQLLVALQGSCSVTLDDGSIQKTYRLDRPDIGLFQDRLVWGEMHNFSQDCILMVFADTNYDESDYIRNYYDFLDACKS